MTEECDHDWRVNPHVVLMSNPPRSRIVCVKCGKKDSVVSGKVTSYNNDPLTWPKLNEARRPGI